MNKEQLVFAALTPLDLSLGAAVGALKLTGTKDKVSGGFYRAVAGVMKKMHEAQSDLQGEGVENIPTEGGVILAINHQSWNDVQVVGATCPRRLRFLAKSEFEEWPVLRRLIDLSDMPYIRRGGDASGMEMAVEALQQGKALAIFPEGTIPGEESVGRHEVLPDTGLLKGHTGAVRMAIAAGVPIVPVGVSGAGAVFPPEVYPRLELAQGRPGVKVTVRFGEPISYEAYRGQELSREELRALTHELMLRISSLVDHDRNYIPMTVPLKPLPQVERLGVLLLHGFTSSVKTVSGLVPYLESANIPYRMPVLRGHGTVYTDLEGVTAQDWYDDAEAALLDLAKAVDKVVVVGLSMGGLVALNLGIRHPDKVAGVTTLAAAMVFRDPLAPLTPVLAAVAKDWPAPGAFNDLSLADQSENYPRFMTDAFLSLRRYAHETQLRLPQVKVPVCVLQSKADQVISPVAANIIYRDVSSEHRELHWFNKSGHEMGQDLERDEVFAKVMSFVQRFQAPVN
ncbi:MAG: alpha/beta fold hydrolase [Deltaproteobacteria bacterium]|nr:alpha/beta fold hydrolase [Deltaproteobacteria bacterium]